MVTKGDLLLHDRHIKACRKTEKMEKLEKENIEMKETIKGLREEGEEYQKKLDIIDIQAMCIRNLANKIREKI
jgi:cell division protein FtsB